MIIDKKLDVTQIEPRLKHPTIFEYFDALSQGEAFIIVNDHDPKPLYYQLLGERGPIFTWEYVENGPQTWQVRIAKPQAEDKHEIELTIGEIAVKDLRKAEVFKKLGIDFCCGGKQSLSEAAASVGLNKIEIVNLLDKAEKEIPTNTTNNLNFNSWDLSFLADYITQIHHNYIREQGPITEKLAEKVAARHGLENPELLPLAKGIQKLMHDLYDHIEKEEQELFPLVKELQSGNIHEAEMQRTIDFLRIEHEDAGQELRDFRALTKDFKLPPHACNSYISLFDRLKEMENDLFQHIHLENNILFPKVLKAIQQN